MRKLNFNETSKVTAGDRCARLERRFIRTGKSRIFRRWERVCNSH